MLRTGLVTGLLLAVLGGTSQAEENPLKYFPLNTAVVIKLKEPDKTLEKAAELVDAVQPGMGQRVNPLGDQLGQLISNPGMIGVDQSKNWYVAVVLSEAGRPIPVFAIPATDTAAFVDAIKDDMNSVVHDNWVLYAEKPAEVPAVDGANITSLLSGPTAELFDKTDVGLFINAGHLTETYAAEVEQMKDQVNDTLNRLQANPPPGVDIGKFMPMYTEFVRYFFRAIDDASHLTITASFGSDGVQFEDYLVAKNGSKCDQWFSSHPAQPIPVLEKLPKGQQLYYGSSGVTSGFMRWALSITSGFLSEEESGGDVKKAMEALNDVDLQTIAGAMRMGGEAPFITAVGVMEGKLGEPFQSAMRAFQTASAELTINGIRQTTELQADAESIGDQKVDVVTVKREVTDESLDPLGIQKAMNDRMFGPEGMQTRTVFGPERAVTATGTQRDMEKLLSGLDNSNVNDFAKQTATLPQPANVIGLIDLPSFYGEMFKLLGSTEGMPFQIDPSSIDNLNLQQSYMGMAFVTEPHAARFRLEIPVAQIQGCIKVGTVVFVSFQQQARGF